MKSPRICILEPYYPPSTIEKRNYDDDLHIKDYLDECGYSFEYNQIHKETAGNQIRDLVKSGKFDIFLNLCDGFWMDETPGIEVIKALSYYNVPFTGAEENFFNPTREQMKIICDVYGIRTPKYILISNVSDVEFTMKLLRFPMIVKHFQSYASIGLQSNSRVETKEALITQTTRMLAEYDKVLIEEFIDGREFSVLVAENAMDREDPIVYAPIEILFPPELGSKGFKFYDMKWVDFEQMSEIKVADQSLVLRLKDLAKNVFLGLDGTGYGRCDIRMDMKGDLYLLEINPNCGIFYNRLAAGSADLILLVDGCGYAGFLDVIFHAAFNRVKTEQKWLLINHPKRGFGLYARKLIKPGEIILSSESNWSFLIDKTQLEIRNMLQPDHGFLRYLQPLSENTWMIRRDSSQTWIPLNHSCDPSAWMKDLNLVARHTIIPGEEITVEYATIMDEHMPLFACNCGSANCRRIISNRDYQLESMQQYEGHFSDYIYQKRKSVINTE